MSNTVLARHSLKTRITLTTLVIFALSLWSLSLFSVRTLQSDMTRQIGEQQFATVSAIGESLNADFSLRFESLRTIAANMVPLMSDKKGLQALLENSPVFNSLFNGGVIVINRNAVAVAEYPLMNRVGLDYSDRDSVMSALNEAKSTAGRPVIGKRWNAPTFLITVPISNTQGKVIGALAGVINLDKTSFLDRITNSRYGRSGGYLLIAPQHEMVVTGTDNRAVMAPTPAPGKNPLFDRYAQGYEGSGRIVDSIGLEVLSASVKISSAGWFLVARIPVSEAFKPIHDMQRNMYIVTLFLTLLACGLTWWSLRRQFSSITETARILADFPVNRDYPEPLPVHQEDEIGQVIGGFNRLLENLGKREESLRKSENQFRIISSITSDILYSCHRSDDGVFRMDWMTGDAEKLFGYDVDAIIAQGCWRPFVVSEDLPLFDRNITDIQPGQTKDAILRISQRDGSIRFTHSIFRVEASSSDQGAHTLYGALQDITERKLAEAALRSSEERFRKIFDTSIDAINVHRIADGRYLEVNPGFSKIFGYERDEVIGRTAMELGLWVDPRERQQFVETLKQESSCTNFETRYLRKNGEQGWVLISAAAIELNGESCVISIARDISAFKTNQEELAQYRAHLEQLVEERTADLKTALQRLRETEFAMDRVGIGIEWIDYENGRLLHVSQADAEMLGYRVEEMLQLRVPDIYPDFDDEKYRKESELIRQQGKATFESVHRTKDGRLVPVDLTIYFQPGGDGVTPHHVVFVMDITQRKEAEKALLDAKEAAEAANTAKSTFLANMSHEIRTPLNGIIGMTHILRRGQVTPEQSERLGKIDTSAEHLLSVINDILDLSKIEAGKVVLDDVPVSINDLTTNVKSIMDERAQTKGLHLRVETDYHYYELRGDQVRLQQALLNYVGNAIKFTPAGVVTLRAIAQEERSDSVLMRFEVQDTGIGIAADAIPRLFTPFEQGGNSTPRKYGGTGLGLTITRRLAELMGGEAGVESFPGVGSTFWFTARLARSKTKSAAVQFDSSEAETVIRAKHQGRQILIVDDEPLNLEIAQFILEDAGLVVDRAEDGVGAVEKAQGNAYAAILMDMQMPNLDGINATKQIRALPEHRATPIIAMTANAFVEDRVRCTEAGMDDFLAKPFRPGSLFTTLLKWMGRRETD